MKKHSVCTLSLALAMSLAPRLADAASHCKGLADTICGQTTACKWQAEVKLGTLTKPDGTQREMNRKAHCRLDVAAAAKIAAGIAGKADAK